MTDSARSVVWQRDEPDSPCLSICVQHPQAGICVGCFRTAEEVANWAKLTPEERQRIRAELPSREVLLTVRKSRPSRRRISERSKRNDRAP